VCHRLRLYPYPRGIGDGVGDNQDHSEISREDTMQVTRHIGRMWVIAICVVSGALRLGVHTDTQEFLVPLGFRN
jgi:hypothetical protein